MSRSLLVLFSSAVFALALHASDRRQWTIEDMCRTVDVSDIELSPDGKRVAYVAQNLSHSGALSASRVYVGSIEGRTAFQLTYLGNSRSPKWSPDNTAVAFLSDRSGKDNIWLGRTDGSEPQPLTALPIDVVRFGWSRD